MQSWCLEIVDIVFRCLFLFLVALLRGVEASNLMGVQAESIWMHTHAILSPS